MSRETESTIEFELSADEMLGLSGPIEPSFTQASPSALDAARAPRLPGAIALDASVALAVLLFAIAGQQISTPGEQPHGAAGRLAASTAAVEPPSIPPPTKPSPVRFANPFDPSEVFEFPPGTSPEYARKAVAEFLIDRARDRHVRHEHRFRIRRELRNS